MNISSSLSSESFKRAIRMPNQHCYECYPTARVTRMHPLPSVPYHLFRQQTPGLPVVGSWLLLGHRRDKLKDLTPAVGVDRMIIIFDIPGRSETFNGPTVAANQHLTGLFVQGSRESASLVWTHLFQLRDCSGVGKRCWACRASRLPITDFRV